MCVYFLYIGVTLSPHPLSASLSQNLYSLYVWQIFFAVMLNWPYNTMFCPFFRQKTRLHLQWKLAKFREGEKSGKSVKSLRHSYIKYTRLKFSKKIFVNLVEKIIWQMIFLMFLWTWKYLNLTIREYALHNQGIKLRSFVCWFLFQTEVNV
jgi:hypothetical protein